MAQLGLVNVKPLSVPPSSGAAWDDTEYNYIVYNNTIGYNDTEYINIKMDFMTTMIIIYINRYKIP